MDCLSNPLAPGQSPASLSWQPKEAGLKTGELASPGKCPQKEMATKSDKTDSWVFSSPEVIGETAGSHRRHPPCTGPLFTACFEAVCLSPPNEICWRLAPFP